MDVLSGHSSYLADIFCGPNMRFHHNGITPVLLLLWFPVVHTLTLRYTPQTNLVIPLQGAEIPNCLNRPPHYMPYEIHNGPEGARRAGVKSESQLSISSCPYLFI